jgi:hypothetical protein
LQLGTQTVYSQANGLSINQNLDGGTSSLTALHIASGVNRNLVLDFAVTGQHTVYLGTQGTTMSNTMVFGSSSSTTSFEFRSNLGFPAALTSGSTLFQVKNTGQLFAPSLSGQATTNVLTYNTGTGQIGYSLSAANNVVTSGDVFLVSSAYTYYILTGTSSTMYAFLPQGVSAYSGMWVVFVNTNQTTAYTIQSDNANIFVLGGVDVAYTLPANTTVKMLYNGTLWFPTL